MLLLLFSLGALWNTKQRKLHLLLYHMNLFDGEDCLQLWISVPALTKCIECPYFYSSTSHHDWLWKQEKKLRGFWLVCTLRFQGYYWYGFFFSDREARAKSTLEEGKLRIEVLLFLLTFYSMMICSNCSSIYCYLLLID